MIYRRRIPVEFNHCDPAGIVFYPRYFEMTNSVVENFFAEVLDYPFARIVLDEGQGVPTVRIEAEFRAPSRLGEVLEFALVPQALGRSSVRFRLGAGVDGAERMRADLTLVWVGRDGRSAPWPQVIRDGLQAALETGERT